ncbi:MAG TPA: uroporphyrinogen decarboxylase family protein [bacterium]|uniref:Methylcobalamin:coenzyme M methyltransferase n=1 Tax=candidate division TA06 bacterium ADurb.Bin417 TaxID=1852828 RepID=A0A1V5MKZ7_UNCT6|nr:MAG: methylcobalamin:coenzyme M methyltransferase [candidate division TA06 bacterium ADurb.Bin417]HNQ34449.1 uroporphyrinogen decarboxylase family protein [bacterium]HNS48141.1 uroporphyrinogen decarboxylase family protein [bacterium]
MNQLEIFRATVAHQPHSGFLYKVGFTNDLYRRLLERYRLPADARLDDYYECFRPAAVQPAPAGPVATPDFSRYFAGEAWPEGSLINKLGVLEIPAHFYHFTGYVSPLRKAASLKELEEFPYPYAGAFDESGMAEKVRAAHEAGKAAMTGIVHLYEHAWQIRGYEEFLQDMIERPEWVECILDRLAERNLKIAEVGARAGVDYLVTGDDIANQQNLMFSPGMWWRFIGSRWARIYAAARRIKPDIQIWYHSDGNVYSLIPKLIEIGVTILNPLQPECLDVVRVKREFGRHLVFDGTVGTQSTFPFGTPEEVTRVVRERKRTLGCDGALILAPTHTLEPEVTPENIEAFVAACREE